MAIDPFEAAGIDPEIIRSGKRSTSPVSLSNDPFEKYGIDPEKIKAEAKQNSLMPAHPISSILGGIATAGQNVHNFLTPKIMNTNYDFSDMNGVPNRGDKIVGDVGKYLPAMAIPGVGAGLLGRIGAEMASQSAYGAAMNPENREMGAAGGAGGVALGGLAGKAFNAMRPSVMFRGNLSPKDLAKNLETAKGTNTGLGNIVNSPSLKRIQENVLSRIPFSGATNIMQKTAQQVTGQGKDILRELGKGLPDGDLGSLLAKGLKDETKKQTKIKNDLYNEVDKIADEAGVKTGRANFQKAAQSALDEIAKSSELEKSFPKDLKNDIEEFAKNDKGNTLSLSNIFKGKLGDQAQELFKNGKKYEGGIVKKLHSALKDDIEESIQNSNHEGLKSAYQEAESNYKNNFKPFEDKDLQKFTRRNADTDTLLGHFIRGGTEDRAVLANKVISGLPKTQTNLPAYAYLSKALDEHGNLNAQQMSSLYRKLGNKQKNVIFQNPEMREKLENFSDLTHKNSEAFNVMHNPPTGQRNLDILNQIAAGAVGNVVGGVKTAGATLAAPVLAKAANHLITNEGFRNRVVHKMIQGKSHEIHPAVMRALGSLLSKSVGGE